MTKEWSLFVNRFEAATVKNYPKAIAIGTQHRDSLFADSTTNPTALICYNRIKTKVETLQIAQTNFLSQKNSQGGAVVSFNDIENILSATVDSWMTSIKIVYPIKSNNFKIFFPHGKGTFTHGKQQAKIDAVLTLIKAIDGDASLATVKTTIQAFYDNMVLIFNTKGGSIIDTKNDSTAVEAARVDMCNVLFGNYGKLIDANQDDISEAAKYFDEPSIRNLTQKSFTLTVKPTTYKNIFKRTFAAPNTQYFRVINKSNVAFKIFLSDTKTGILGDTFIQIDPNTTTLHLLTELGDPTSKPFMNVLNVDAAISGRCSIKVL